VSGAASVTVPAGDVELDGDLGVPDGASALVVFAHGSGSSRLSPRSRRVAAALRDAGLGTLLVDLLTRAEEDADRCTGRLRFDVERLAGRLVDTADWLGDGPLAELRLGLFGASTGAAAALVAAAARPDRVGAVVSRGGRPDLARDALPVVRAPTLLLVGGADVQVLELNCQALERLGSAARQLVVVPGATHLFEEPGALDEVARLAAEWFGRFVALRGGATDLLPSDRQAF
jgi:dienelactone hydrolase